jgi:hypothetical protein
MDFATKLRQCLPEKFTGLWCEEAMEGSTSIYRGGFYTPSNEMWYFAIVKDKFCSPEKIAERVSWRYENNF